MSLIIKLAFAGLFALFVYSCVARMGEESANSRPVDVGAMDALVNCQMTIKRLSKNPSSAVVPRAPGYVMNGDHYFSWVKGDGLTLMNDFGASLDTGALCVTSPDGKQVKHLEIAGERVL